MLFDIVTQDDIGPSLAAIRNAYWPEAQLLAQATDRFIAGVINPNASPDDIAKAIGEIIDGDPSKSIIGIVSQLPLYQVFTAGQPDTPTQLPFLANFHRLFAKRRWNRLVRQPILVPDRTYLFQLEEPQDTPHQWEENWSENLGDFRHFVNVVAATARLIQFLNDQTHFQPLLKGSDSAKTLQLHFDGASKRTFMLMLAAFYHDIGKTVVYHRHGMEGAIIVQGFVQDDLKNIQALARDHYSIPFSAEDLTFLAAMIEFHDYFGNFSTGEGGYVRMVDLVDRIVRYARFSCPLDIAKANQMAERTLFDVWLLNVADALVSRSGVTYRYNNQDYTLEDKTKDQTQTTWTSKAHAEAAIRGFFLSQQDMRPLRDDLNTALQLVERAFAARGDLSVLVDEAKTLGRTRALERMRRLIIASLAPVTPPLASLPELDLESIIRRAIDAVADYAEFSAQLAQVRHMDYALGFFQKLAKHMRRIPEYELQEPWTEHLVVEDYIAVIMRVLCRLLSRSVIGERVVHIEFEDARNRLTKQKMDDLFGERGPAAQDGAIETVMRTVFVY